MPLFRRRTEPAAPPSGRPAPAASGPAVPGGADWRDYDLVAAEYGRVLEPRLALPARDLVGAMALPPGWRVLDVGTGTGVTARIAAEAGARVVGVDLSEPMLREAARRGGGVAYAAGAAIDLPFRDGSFHAAVASFVLSHFAAYDTALFDMLRVLRPGGRMGVTAWGPARDELSSAWRAIAEEFVGAGMLADATRRAVPWEERFADLGALTEALHEAGLRDIQAETREYRFAMTAEDYLVSKEITAEGRFLRHTLGDPLWDRFRQRTREEFARQFPPSFNDFREVNLAVGTRP